MNNRSRARRFLHAHAFEASSIGDLAFLLLIYFIVTSSFILRQGIFLSLPSKTAGSIRIDQKELVSVYPQNDGVMVNGMKLNDNEFANKLARQSRENKSVVLIIYMKSGVRYERLIDTLSIAKENRITKISLKYIRS